MSLPNLNPFGFRPKKIGSAFGDEFEAWEPVKDYRKEEQYGSISWNGPELQPINTKAIIFHHRLEHYFGDLFKRLWVKAEKPTGPQRNILAQTRAPQNPLLPSQAYRPAVNPTSMDPQMLGMMPGNVSKHLAGIAVDWEFHKTLERLSAFLFRGDGRSPDQLKAAGGFTPPSSRNDDGYIKGAVYEQFCNYMQRRFNKDLKAAFTADEFLALVRQTVVTDDAKQTFFFYTVWRAMVKSEELHMGRMLAEEALKAYISTTKAVPVAKGFACKRASKTGWVYCSLVRGGFVVPERGKTQWTQIFGEQEVAMPGPIPWEDIVAARQVKDNLFDPAAVVYFRKGFDKTESEAFEKIFKLLCGKKQG